MVSLPVSASFPSVVVWPVKAIAPLLPVSISTCIATTLSKPLVLRAAGIENHYDLLFAVAQDSNWYATKALHVTVVIRQSSHSVNACQSTKQTA